MPELFSDTLAGAFDLLKVVLGFSAIIIIHEGGHFLAARWAKIRVLAFAIGFGPALFSFRKGLGFRRGSSEPEYQKLVTDAQGEPGERGEYARSALSGRVSPTEYRLNVLPFGGYVKMLGQDDADPGATSNDPDSYQNCRPWKRMVVISAGVVFNIITAAILFIIVFNPAVGLRTEPAKIGEILDPTKPAATTMALNAAELGVTEPGLKPGDVVLSVNGERPEQFTDFSLAIAMGHKDTPLAVDIQRPGVNGVLHFSIIPKPDDETQMLGIGARSAASSQIAVSTPRENKEIQAALDSFGFEQLRPGMRLVSVDGKPSAWPYDIGAAVDRSGGSPVSATFQPLGSGPPVTIEIKPRPALPTTDIEVGQLGQTFHVDARNLFGLMPVLAVGTVEPGSPAAKAGIKNGDVFAQLGTTEWPSVPDGMSIIRACKDGDLRVVVARQVKPGSWQEIDLHTIHTKATGQLGFVPEDTSFSRNIVNPWPTSRVSGPTPTGGAIPGLMSGSRIIAVDGRPVRTLGELRNELQSSIRAIPADAPMRVMLSTEPPRSDEAPAPQTPSELAWTLSEDEARSLVRLGWESPLSYRLFDREQFSLKSETLFGGIGMGLHETRRVMMNTYLTFARLFQGSLKVEHLHGPVGIAHLGVSIADRGNVWLLFFMALISVNLAVINFLPMPIADGGHMVFLLYEQLTGRPPSVRFQNAAAVVGLVLIGTLFLVVTFNDVTHVFKDLTRFFSRT